jgi:hypothetical protein
MGDGSDVAAGTACLSLVKKLPKNTKPTGQYILAVGSDKGSDLQILYVTSLHTPERAFRQQHRQAACGVQFWMEMRDIYTTIPVDARRRNPVRLILGVFVADAGSAQTPGGRAAAQAQFRVRSWNSVLQASRIASSVGSWKCLGSPLKSLSAIT